MGANKLARFVGRALLQLALLGGAWVVLFPFLWLMSSALKTEPQVYAYPPRWLPQPIEWRNLSRAWQAIPLARYCLNSALVAGTAVVGQLLTSTMAGYALARLHFPGRDLILLGFVAAMMIPSEVIIIPRFLILRRLHWLDTLQGLIVPALVHPFGILMLRQFLLSLPDELEDAARIDGCSRLGVLFRIAVPLSRPALGVLGVLVFLWQWNAFLWPLIVLSSQRRYTLQIGLAMLRSELGTEWAVLMAATLLACVPGILLYLLAHRYGWMRAESST